MPVNNEDAQRLEDNLSRTIFKSSEDFVNYYNTGLINKRHEDVVNVANEIVTTYRNLRESSGKLVYISKQEIYLDELFDTLNDWSVILKVRDELKRLCSEETLNINSVIVFTTNKTGFFTEQNQDAPLNSSKLFAKYEAIKNIYHKHSTITLSEDVTEEYVTFQVNDFLQLDDTVLERMHKEI
jgi:hypothetical protein